MKILQELLIQKFNLLLLFKLPKITKLLLLLLLLLQLLLLLPILLKWLHQVLRSRVARRLWFSRSNIRGPMCTWGSDVLTNIPGHDDIAPNRLECWEHLAKS
jgi:hypothetical protein